jgi:hypothetical protein
MKSGQIGQISDHDETGYYTSEEPNIYNFQESTVFSQYTIFFIQ